MDLRVKVASGLYECGGFKDKTQSPEGKGFKLKLHQTKPDAPLSPIYIDLRVLRGYPVVLRDLVDLMQPEVAKLEFDRFADIPHSSSPLVAGLLLSMMIPMVTPRTEVKDYGTQDPLVGPRKKGDRILVIDDLVTEGHSKLEAIERLTSQGLVVEDVMVMVDRQQGGREQLAEAGITLHALYTLDELLDLYRQEGLVSDELYQEIQDYRREAA